MALCARFIGLSSYCVVPEQTGHKQKTISRDHNRDKTELNTVGATGLAPTNHRREQDTNASVFTLDNLEYGINMSAALSNSIEGDVWHPLPDYRNPCWVEKIASDSRFNRLPPRPLPKGRQSVRGQRQFKYLQLIHNRTVAGSPWKMRCLPYTYIIGVTKSGTSDFYRYLTSHQDIDGHVAKEIHYWNARRYPKTVLLHGHETKRPVTFTNYLHNFDVAAHGINISRTPYQNGSVWHPKIIVDGSIATLWEDNGWTQVPGNRGLKSPRYTTARTMAHFQPKAKLIVLLRDPVERLYSYYRMFVNEERKNNVEYFHNQTMEVLNAYGECLQVYTMRECAYSGEIEKVSFTVNIRSSLYATFLEDWLEVYPKEQFHIVRSEDYYANRKVVLGKTVNFLGLNPYSKELADALTAPDAQVVLKNIHHVPMLNSTRRILQSFFQPFNKELAEMFGREFWTYEG